MHAHKHTHLHTPSHTALGGKGLENLGPRWEGEETGGWGRSFEMGGGEPRMQGIGGHRPSSISVMNFFIEQSCGLLTKLLRPKIKRTKTSNVKCQILLL
jgi:hypothetical protein